MRRTLTIAVLLFAWSACSLSRAYVVTVFYASGDLAARSYERFFRICEYGGAAGAIFAGLLAYFVSPRKTLALFASMLAIAFFALSRTIEPEWILRGSAVCYAGISGVYVAVAACLARTVSSRRYGLFVGILAAAAVCAEVLQAMAFASMKMNYDRKLLTIPIVLSLVSAALSFAIPSDERTVPGTHESTPYRAAPEEEVTPRESVRTVAQRFVSKGGLGLLAAAIGIGFVSRFMHWDWPRRISGTSNLLATHQAVHTAISIASVISLVLVGALSDSPRGVRRGVVVAMALAIAVALFDRGRSIGESRAWIIGASIALIASASIVCNFAGAMQLAGDRGAPLGVGAAWVATFVGARWLYDAFSENSESSILASSPPSREVVLVAAIVAVLCALAWASGSRRPAEPRKEST